MKQRFFLYVVGAIALATTIAAIAAMVTADSTSAQATYLVVAGAILVACHEATKIVGE